MTENQSMEVQEKQELLEKEEKTIPARYFVPYTDIYETEEGLTLVVEMAGVEKTDIDISIEANVLQIEGRIDLSSYSEMKPVYTEYNVGHYNRKFSLPDAIDQSKISAEMEDGVLTLRLPKAEKAKPRRIEIS